MSRHTRLSLLICLLILAGCGRPPVAAPPETPQVRGRMILWHGWSGPQADVLNALIDRFVSIYPDIQIVRSTVPPDQLVPRFSTRAAMGLGPDLLIVPARAIPELAQEALIQDLTSYIGVDPAVNLTRYFAPALETVHYEDRLYGLPLALNTMVLYYNRELVRTPPTTLDGLLQEASEERTVSLNTDFYRAFWGVKAFSGQLFDEEGRVILDEGGFANWLGWLKIAQGNPGIFMGTDQEIAAELFATGRVAYYVGSSTEVHVLRESLGEDMVGVARLPAGPQRPAGPFLESEAIVINASSSPTQTELVLRLARFLTGTEQQAQLARQAAHIPTTVNVRVDPRLHPATATFMAQIQTAVPLPNLPQMSAVLTQGDTAYVLALEGVVSAAEAAQQLTTQVNAAFGLDENDETTAALCTLGGPLSVWHTYEGQGDSALHQVAQEFMRTCPGVYITLKQMEPEALHSLYQQALAEDQAPDILIAPSESIALLAEEELIKALDTLAPPELMQRYLPAANQAISYQGHLYGLPLSLRMTALYYNPEQVANPARTLTDLLNEATEERSVALPIDAHRALWGAAAFGGLIHGEAQRPHLEIEGLAQWLDWLKQAGETPGVVGVEPEADIDVEELVTLFARGKVAYLVGETSLLWELWSTLGIERVRVAPLPAGPVGESCPLLSADALLFTRDISPRTAELAMAFADYATDIEGQRLLMTLAAHVPANVNVHTEEYPAIAGFLDQAKMAAILQTPRVAPELWEEGNRIIGAWLAGDGEIKDLQRFADAVTGMIALDLQETEAIQE
jgi:ABC-type glycerol-3-phosphate transport system substrate-binding protein